MRVLYLSYTGLLEPLGQSQVLAYLRLLSRDHAITLITFEKPADVADAAAMGAQRVACEALGIRWIALTYHHRPRLLATAWDLTVFAWVALREAWRGRIELVHCRSYIPSFVGLVVKGLAGKPFIFDMRAFWPEEMVAAGRLKMGSPMYRVLKAAERACLTRAAAVVSLTQAGVDHMRLGYGRAVERVDFTVIPTCVDLEQFRPRGETDPAPGPLVIGSLGTVLSGWFKFDWLTAFFSAASEVDPSVRFAIVTPEDAGQIAALAQAGGTPGDRLEIYGVPPRDVPKVIAGLGVVPMFYTTGEASVGRSPTRMGEVLACGVPVVVNAGVGDVDAIVCGYNVGVVVTDASAATMRAAALALMALLRDPELGARCRRAAEESFSLERGAALYDGIYAQITKSG